MVSELDSGSSGPGSTLCFVIRHVIRNKIKEIFMYRLSYKL